MKALMVAVVLCGLVGVASAAPAPGFTVESRGDAVVITVPGVTAAGPVVSGAGIVDVPLGKPAVEATYQRLSDKLVRKVEVGDAAHPRVRIKLRGKAKAGVVAKGVTVSTSMAGIEIVVARAGKGAAAAGAASAAAPAAASASASGTASGTASASASGTASGTAPASASGTASASGAASASASGAASGAVPAADSLPVPVPAPAPSTTAAPVTGAPSRSLPWGSLALVGGVIAGAALIVRAQRTRKHALPSALEIRSTMPFGKSRLVLLGARDRELLVAVDSKGIRVLDSWRRDGDIDADDLDAPGAPAAANHNVPAAAASIDALVPPAGPAPMSGPTTGTPKVARTQPPPAPRASPSVSGILKLRRGTREMIAAADPDQDGSAAPDDSAASDADWTRDFLAQFRSRGGAQS